MRFSSSLCLSVYVELSEAYFTVTFPAPPKRMLFGLVRGKC